MPVSLTGGAGVHYRTRLLSQPKAAAFAQALMANPRFDQVEVVESRQARSHEAWFVRFKPVNEDRLASIQADQQQQRQDRAIAQGSCYLWCRDANCGREFVWCLSTSGEVYEVSPGRACTCPDFTYRAGPAGLHCKHLVALSLGLGVMTEFPEPPLGSGGDPR